MVLVVVLHTSAFIVRDGDIRADFQEDTVKNYFDFAHYRIMYLKEALGFEA
jgi:hypothetical protein